MFDSTKCTKAEACFYCDISKKNKNNNNTGKEKKVFRSISELKKKFQVPYQGRTHTFFQAYIQHLRKVSLISTQSTFSPRPPPG